MSVEWFTIMRPENGWPQWEPIPTPDPNPGTSEGLARYGEASGGQGRRATDG